MLGTKPVQAWLKSRVSKQVRGPGADQRANSDGRVWGEVSDGAGNEVKAQLRTPNGYLLTVTASLGITQRLLEGPRPAGGYYTPSQLMGADYVLGLPGVARL